MELLPLRRRPGGGERAGGLGWLARLLKRHLLEHAERKARHLPHPGLNGAVEALSAGAAVARL